MRWGCYPTVLRYKRRRIGKHKPVVIICRTVQYLLVSNMCFCFLSLSLNPCQCCTLLDFPSSALPLRTSMSLRNLWSASATRVIVGVMVLIMGCCNNASLECSFPGNAVLVPRLLTTNSSSTYSDEPEEQSGFVRRWRWTFLDPLFEMSPYGYFG